MSNKNNDLKSYQSRQGMSFVRQVPDFLKAMMGDEYEKDQLAPKFEKLNYEDEEKDDLISDRPEERPQVVVVKEGKHLSEDQVNEHYKKLGKLVDTKIGSKECEFTEVRGPPIDEKGRILFRTKRSRDDSVKEINKNSKPTEIKGSSKNKKGSDSKKKKAKPILSFDQDDD